MTTAHLIQVSQYLSRYSSTVFACETSADTRYIKCDFPSCPQHSGNRGNVEIYRLKFFEHLFLSIFIAISFHNWADLLHFCDIAKNTWMLNSVRNVKNLEKHVGQEVAKFVKENLVDNFEDKSHLKRSEEILASQRLELNTRKVFTIDDNYYWSPLNLSKI